MPTALVVISTILGLIYTAIQIWNVSHRRARLKHDMEIARLAKDIDLSQETRKIVRDAIESDIAMIYATKVAKPQPQGAWWWIRNMAASVALAGLLSFIGVTDISLGRNWPEAIALWIFATFVLGITLVTLRRSAREAAAVKLWKQTRMQEAKRRVTDEKKKALRIGDAAPKVDVEDEPSELQQHGETQE